MDTLLSKAFWLGRNMYIIGFVKATGRVDSSESATLTRTVHNFARGLNIEVPEIPPLNSGENIQKLTETIRMDLATVQSELVANCFQFGFHFSSWANFRGGYTFGDAAARSDDSGIDLTKVEMRLREEARQIFKRAV